MDPKQTRKDAEKAARELLNARAAYIGDLRVAQDDVNGNPDIIAAAQIEADTVLTDARARAADIIAAAQQTAGRRTDTYTITYRKAIDAGWTTAELNTLGFTNNTARKKRTNTPSKPDDQTNDNTATQ